MIRIPSKSHGSHLYSLPLSLPPSPAQPSSPLTRLNHNSCPGPPSSIHGPDQTASQHPNTQTLGAWHWPLATLTCKHVVLLSPVSPARSKLSRKQPASKHPNIGPWPLTSRHLVLFSPESANGQRDQIVSNLLLVIAMTWMSANESSGMTFICTRLHKHIH